MSIRRLSCAIWLVAEAAVAAPASVPPPQRAAPAAAPKWRDDAALDAAAERKRDELIAELEAFLPRAAENERKADLTFQLAELWWEKARFQSLQEVKQYDEAHERWSAEHRGEEPRLDASRSAEQRQKSLRLYQEVLDKYPSYGRTDEVLFVAAYNLAEAGRKADALRKYQQLIQGYPASRFVPDAYVQMGEQYFAANDLARARAAYEKAAAFRLPKLYPFALYKLAWCDYNAGQHGAAIAKFQEVVSYSEAQARSEAGAASDRIQLKNEALRDIVLSYVQVDSIERAVAYLKEKGGPRQVELVDRLAAAYFDAGKFEQAIRVYRILQGDAPQDPRAPVWQQKILLAYDKLNRREQVAAEVKKLVAEYGPRGAWAKANANQKAALAEAGEIAETALRELVQDYHQEAIKTKSAATYRLARDIYRQYLDTFPHSESAYAMRFFYAEILYSLEQWDEAAAQYAQVADADAHGQYAQKAAYDAILSLEKSVAISRGLRKQRELADAAKIDERKAKGEVAAAPVVPHARGKAAAEQKIPDNEQQLVAACERYLRVAPGAKDEVVIRYKAALIFYDHDHLDEAARRFAQIIDRWPQDPWAEKAAQLSLDILNQREDWVALSDLAHRYLANAQLTPKGSKLEKDVARIGEGARFKAAMQTYEQKKDSPLAAREFRAFVAEYPKSQYAPKALYNALVIADQASELDVEIAAGEQLVRDHPSADPAILKLTLPALGSACERSGRFRDAIRHYEQAFARWPTDPHAAGWLSEAALQRETLGDDAGAAAAWEQYLKKFASRPDAARVAFNLGLIYERQKKWRRAADHWATFASRRGATAAQLFLARYRQGLALRELKSPQAARVLAEIPQRYARLRAADKSSPPLIEAAAHARFLTADTAFADFASIRFQTTRQRELVQRLKLKNARLKGLLASYGEVVAIGSPRFSEAAFARIGEAYRNFNKDLLDAPMPRGLDAEQEQLYRNTLEAQALPLEDKAVEAFQRAVAVAEKSGVYSEWLLKAQDLLRDYQPDSFGEIHAPELVQSDPLPRITP